MPGTAAGWVSIWHPGSAACPVSAALQTSDVLKATPGFGQLLPYTLESIAARMAGLRCGPDVALRPRFDDEVSVADVHGSATRINMKNRSNGRSCADRTSAFDPQESSAAPISLPHSCRSPPQRHPKETPRRRARIGRQHSGRLRHGAQRPGHRHQLLAHHDAASRAIGLAEGL